MVGLVVQEHRNRCDERAYAARLDDRERGARALSRGVAGALDKRGRPLLSVQPKQAPPIVSVKTIDSPRNSPGCKASAGTEALSSLLGAVG
jgi:hypothetical protein